MAKRKQKRKPSKITAADILNTLDTLTPAEKMKLMEGLGGAEPGAPARPTSKKKPGSKRKQNRNKGVDSKPSRIIIPGEETPKPKKQKATTRKNNKPKVLKPGESQGQSQAYIESMPRSREDIDEVNKFDIDEFSNTAKEDTAWQKKVDPVCNGAAPAERREDYEGVEINCHKCNRTFKVGGEMLHYDAMEKEWRYVCNKCAITGK